MEMLSLPATQEYLVSKMAFSTLRLRPPLAHHLFRGGLEIAPVLSPSPYTQLV